MKLAQEFSCPVVWIAERKDEYLPLVNQPAIRGIMFRTATAADLEERTMGAADVDTVGEQSRHRHIIQASEVGSTDAKAKTDNELAAGRCAV
jgi:hypothetical protein